MEKGASQVTAESSVKGRERAKQALTMVRGRASFWLAFSFA
jgi:hypothetical protein